MLAHFKHIALTAFASLCLAAPSLAQAAVKTTADPRFEAASATSDQAVARIESLREHINRTTMSLDAMADALDYDPNAAISYVQNEIGFLPYAGSMRGEVGTMATGSGSVLDQALLLGGLLDVMGFDVALAFGELSEADTDRLMRASSSVKAPDIAVDASAIARENARNINSVDPVDPGEDLDLEMTKAALMKALSNTPAKTDGQLLRKMRADVRKRYVWVMHRSNPAEDWKSVHPAFGSDARTTKPPVVQPTRYASVAVPDDRAHTMSFKLSVEVTTNGRTKTEFLMATDTFATAELADQQLELSLAPLGLDATDASGTQSFSYAQPLLNGRSAPTARAVSPYGEFIRANTANAANSAVASGSLFGSAMRDLKDKTASPHITGIILETVYASPLGRTNRRRVLRDFSDSKPGDALSATDMTLSLVVDTNIGQTNQARVMDRQLDAISDTMRHMPYQMVMAQMAFGDAETSLPGYSDNPDLLAQPPKPSWPGMALAHEAFTPTRFQGQAVLPVTAQVSTLLRHTRGGTSKEDAPELVQVMDLMMTDVIVLKDSKADAAATRALGVQRTLHESLLMRGQISGNPLFSKLATLETLKTKGDVQAFAKARSLSSLVTQRLEDDVDQSGHLLVATQDINNLHWWKLDSATGEALGMSVHGGAATASYVLALQHAISTTTSASMVMYGMWKCNFALASDQRDSKTSRSQLVANYEKCMKTNAAMFVWGSAVGMAATAGMQATMAFNTSMVLEVFGYALGLDPAKIKFP